MLNKIFHGISIFITIVILLLAFNFSYSFLRIKDVVFDFVDCLALFSNEFFGTDFNLNLNIINRVYDIFEFWFPLTWESLKNIISDYFVFIFQKDSFLLFYYNSLDFLLLLMRFLLMFIPLIMVLELVLDSVYFKPNTVDINVDSKQLVFFKKTVLKWYGIVRAYISFYFAFLKKEKNYFYFWIIAFCFYFNFFAIIIHFLAYYIYFLAVLDFKHLYIFIYKILFDLVPMFKFVPGFFWVLLAIKIFHTLRKNAADATFLHYENRNKGFVNSLGQQSMIVGPSGTKKTLTNTDMTLSQEQIYRDKTLDKILGYDIMFPHFSFIILEKEIERAFKYHEVWNLPSIKVWIRKRISRSFKVEVIDGVERLIFAKNRFFEYDVDKYPLTYFNGFKEIHLFDCLEFYAQSYFVYNIPSSLILSNHSIRSDNYYDSIGNFPLWHSGFFNTDPNYVNNVSRYSHILDFDSMRLLKKIDPGSNNTIDIGVISWTEGGKERGNQIENRGMKKDSDVANPLNDGTNSWLKIARHNSMIDNDSFLKIILDDQRPESLGADARELCEKIIHIQKTSDYKNSLLLFRFEYIIYSLIKSKWEDIYKKYRYYRSDNTLLFFILKSIYSVYFKYINRLYNRYGYIESTLACEKGTLDGELETNKYYLMFPKIYLNRYSTDCYSDFFFQKGIKSKKGINDIKEYESVRASIDELAEQNSYFINDLIKNNL